MPRRPLIAANWKMNNAPAEAFADDNPFMEKADVDVIVFPTFLDIATCLEHRLVTGGQYGHSEEHGAHTGDVSMAMLAAGGCKYVLCGHSERRAHHGETDEDIAAQVIAALEHKLHPIVCIGETEEERKAGKEKEVIIKQMKLLPMESDLTIAYEPVWAIGTGKTATPEQAQEMHAFIRAQLPDDKKEGTRILYGGSMKPDNAEDLLKQEDIDGGLIGGASLDADAFGEIVEIAEKLAS